MAAQKGRAVLLKYYNGSTYVACGGARKIGLGINNELVDITNADDSGIRKLLEGAGVNSVSVTFEGIYVEDAAWNAIRVAASLNAHMNFQFYMPGTSPKTYQGSFAFPNFNENAEYNGAVSTSLKLESAGAITIS